MARPLRLLRIHPSSQPAGCRMTSCRGRFVAVVWSSSIVWFYSRILYYTRVSRSISLPFINENKEEERERKGSVCFRCFWACSACLVLRGRIMRGAGPRPPEPLRGTGGAAASQKMSDRSNTDRGTVDDEEGDMRRRVARECEDALTEAAEARRGYARVAAWDEGKLIQAMARLKNPTIAWRYGEG